MSTNAVRLIVRPAARGSKEGWVTVSGEVPPDVALEWRALMIRRGMYQSDLIHEAVNMMLKSDARKRREQERQPENGAGRRGSDLEPVEA